MDIANNMKNCEELVRWNHLIAAKELIKRFCSHFPNADTFQTVQCFLRPLNYKYKIFRYWIEVVHIYFSHAEITVCLNRKQTKKTIYTRYNGKKRSHAKEAQSTQDIHKPQGSKAQKYKNSYIKSAFQVPDPYLPWMMI